MALQNYPIGLQNFKGLIQNEKLYVDKTFWIHSLVTSHKFNFLSRPRRFGKSLLLSTLHYLFKGEKDLFKGLFIQDNWSFEAFPVIKISFSTLAYERGKLETAIKNELLEIAKNEELFIESEFTKDIFKCLIEQLFHKYQKQVVILVDEYDKPIIDYLDSENIHFAKENRRILKSFYSVLKDADEFLRFVFITGVTKFSQVSIFSDLNNLYDISLNPKYNEICGITQQELETYFREELKKYDTQKIKLWYNGYKWDVNGKTLYNPFSLLNFFDQGLYLNFWYSTGTPTFLMNLAKRERLYEIDKITLDISELNSFDFENIKLLPLLYQTGYLTINSVDEEFQIVRLTYPNQEVKESFIRNLADTYMNSNVLSAKSVLYDLLNSLKQKDFEKLHIAINQAFSQIPYDLWKKDNEHFYHAIIHLLFSLLGVYIQSEVHTKEGRADAIIQIEEGIFCFEFKLDQSAEIALQQIKDKNYLTAFQQINKPKYAIGINFSSDTKSIEQIAWEILS